MKSGYFESKNRLTFKRSVIDALDDDGFYINKIETLGTFKISKKDFYKYFDNVVKSASWEKGLYHYRTFPKWAERWRSKNNGTKNDVEPLKRCAIVQKTVLGVNNMINFSVDLVGNEIREKIREIGKLWYNSPNKKKISKEVVDYWENLIKEWIKDKELPLVVRKDKNLKGQEVEHPTGRKIVFADNSFAIWVLCNVINNKKYSLEEIKNLLKSDEIPFMLAAEKEQKTKAKYKKNLRTNEISGWKLCHKDGVGFNKRTKIADMGIDEIEEHFYKYANPNNMFVLPKEIGFLGELKEFIEEQK